MTKTDWTAAEVRAQAKLARGFSEHWQRCLQEEMLNDLANRIEADVSAVPVATVGCHWLGDALGFDLNDISEPLPPSGAKLFTRPPAQPAQVNDLLPGVVWNERTCSAHIVKRGMEDEFCSEYGCPRVCLAVQARATSTETIAQIEPFFVYVDEKPIDVLRHYRVKHGMELPPEPTMCGYELRQSHGSTNPTYGLFCEGGRDDPDTIVADTTAVKLIRGMQFYTVPSATYNALAAQPQSAASPVGMPDGGLWFRVSPRPRCSTRRWPCKAQSHKDRFDYPENKVVPCEEDYSNWADAIDAHLATPAQTVNIEAVREVIAQLKDFGFAETKDMDKWSDKLSQAIGDKT